MFIEVHKKDADSTQKLAFVRSLNVQAFPCGRRRSEQVTAVTGNDKYYIPYDPEAKLNTEKNNRQHSSSNGFTQNYIKCWTEDEISIVIGGYSFKIDPQYANQETLSYKDTFDAFGKTLGAALGESGSSIYANIRIESVPLYSGFTTYYTEILRDQTTAEYPSASIDILQSNANANTLRTKPEECFYFAGLSFSTEPLAEDSTPKEPVWEEFTTKEDGVTYQRVVSLRVLDLVDGVWRLHQPALLPNVAHGPIEDSVQVGTAYANQFLRREVVGEEVVDTTVPSMRLTKVANETYRIKFSPVTVTETN